MKYQLLNNAKGVLIDRTTIITDVKGSPALSFLLPNEGDYYALLTTSTGIALKCKIHSNGDCPLRSRDLLGKRQYYDLTVTQLDENGEIIRTWACEPLLVSSLNFALKSQWQISGGMTEEAAIERIGELEIKNAGMKDGMVILRSILDDSESKRLADRDTISAELKKIKADSERLAEAYNNSIAIINDLSVRLRALEKNYDPTLID